MANILLITDSRGLGFESILKELLKEYPTKPHVKILAARGANLKSIEEEAVKELSLNRYDQAYVMLGVNDLTKFWMSKQIILAYDNIPELVDEMDNSYTSLKTKLSYFCPTIIVCHLIGLDILRYNLSKTSKTPLIIADYPQMQKIIDGSITYINRAIDSMNISSNVVGPWLEDTIHTAIKGKKGHKYMRLYDGLHPDKITKNLWAKKLVKSFFES